MPREDFYRSLFMQSMDGVFFTQADGRIFAANPAACRMLGRTEEEICGLGRSGVVDVSDPRLPGYLEQRIRTGQVRGELNIMRADGSVFPAEITSAVFDDAQGNHWTAMIMRDISERKHAEAALQKSEERFRQISLLSTVGIFQTDADGLCSYVNPRWCEITGLSAEQAKGKGWSSTLHPDERARVEAAWYESVRNDRLFQMEYRFLTPDGRETWVLGQASIQRDDQGVMVGCIGTITDITERIQTEAALRRSEFLLNQTQRLTQVGGWEYDAKSQRIVWTDEVYRIYEVSADYDPSNVAQDVSFYAPEDRASIDHAFHHAVESGAPFDLELHFVGALGTPKWVRTIGQAEFRSGKVARVFGNIIDITALRRTQEALRATDRHYRALFEQSTFGVAEIDSRSGRFLKVNRLYCEMLGYEPGEMLQLRFQDITYPEDVQRGLDHTERLRHGELGTFQMEKRYVRKDGSVVWASLRVVQLRNTGDAPGVQLAIVEDITERKRVQDALRAAKVAAEEATQAKDRFLAVLSHELRTPLTPVLAAVQVLQRMPGLREEIRGPLEIMRRNVELEARLIDDLLDLTRIVQGKLALQRKPLDIATVIERAVETTRSDIEARMLHFDMAVEAGKYRVNGDNTRLQQVIWNLLNNAVKFTPRNGWVRVRCRAEGQRVIIEVSDSGIGFQPEAAERLFDAFEQGGITVTRRFGGMGLGLAIAKKLVEMHEGTISAQSGGSNKGSTFRVSLPLSFTALAAEAEKPAHAARGMSKRILLVEDNADTAAMMKLLLEAFGYEIETAADVAQALKAIDLDGFDLLISDLGLPDQSGIELMQELRRRGNALKGIALSGYGSEDDVRRSKEAGFRAHLTKPVDADALVDTVSRIV